METKNKFAKLKKLDKKVIFEFINVTGTVDFIRSFNFLNYKNKVKE